MFPFQQDHNSQISFSQDPNQNNQEQDFIIQDNNFVLGQFNSMPGYNYQPNYNINLDYNVPVNFQGNFTSIATTTTAATAVVAATTATASGHVAANDEHKKAIRKEIERERRKQMSSLQSQLRSLLPPEAVKGKRSTSDHMNEAVKYIQQLKNNIHELNVKRDNLKSLSNSGSFGSRDGSGSSSSGSSNRVTMTPSLDGFVINLLCSDSEQAYGVRFSRVLEAVTEYGYIVVSYTSVRKEERIYHTIYCQATNSGSVDVHALQQKLNDVVLLSTRNQRSLT